MEHRKHRSIKAAFHNANFELEAYAGRADALLLAYRAVGLCRDINQIDLRSGDAIDLS